MTPIHCILFNLKCRWSRVSFRSRGNVRTSCLFIRKDRRRLLAITDQCHFYLFLAKVLERIVFNELFAHVRPIISDKQHGFLPGRSCATNLCTMLHTAWTNISAGSQTDVIYTDYSSAFQSVNHILLLHKLKNSYRISDKAFDWIGSYLSGREQRVVVAGKCSEWVPVRSGTLEGGLLSPLLFACFVNDLPNSLEADTLMFADDVKTA